MGGGSTNAAIEDLTYTLDIDFFDFCGSATNTVTFTGDSIEFDSANLSTLSGLTTGGLTDFGGTPEDIELVAFGDFLFFGVGADSGDLIFFVVINPNDGEVSIVQYQQVNHLDPTDPDDPVSFDVPLIVTSAAGTTTTTLTVVIDDDAPSLVEGEGSDTDLDGAVQEADIIEGGDGVANVLFVSDSGVGGDMATVLEGDGHTVTTVLDDFTNGSNPALLGDLSGYEVIVWSASGNGFGTTHTDPAVFAALEAFVADGGKVFVTVYDSVASPSDPLLIAFLGGTVSDDTPGEPGAIINDANSLTTGVIDIQGVTPTGAFSDKDELEGLQGDTLGVAPSGSDNGFQWTLRTLGDGEIAYVSAGIHTSTQFGASGSDPAWTDTSAGGDGAYNAALRNFVFNADHTIPDTTSGFIDVDFGKDGPGIAIIDTAVTATDPDANDPSAPIALESGGLAVTWIQVSDGVLEATDSDSSEVLARLTVNTDGTWTYKQFVAFDHPDVDEVGDDDQIALTFDVALTDSDGDPVNVQIKVTVDDDGPVADIQLEAEVEVVLDETEGPKDGDPNATDDDIDSGNLDPFGGTYSTPIGALSGVTLVNSGTSDAGADGEKSLEFSLDITDSASGLKTTDGTAIELFLETDGTVTGRTGGSAGTVIFAIAIDNDGEVAVAQYFSLQHNLNGLDDDDSVDLAGKLDAVIEITDGDDDTATDNVAIGGLIRFEDDGPELVEGEGSQTDDMGMVSEADIVDGGGVQTMNFNGVTNFTASYTEGDLKVSVVPAQSSHLHVVGNNLFSHSGPSDTYLFEATGGGTFSMFSFDVVADGGAGRMVSSTGAIFDIPASGVGTHVLPAGFQNVDFIRFELTSGSMNLDNISYTLGGPATDSGFIDIDYGADGQGDVTVSTSVAATDPDDGPDDPVTLKSGGLAVTWTEVSDGVLEATDSGSTEVLARLTVNADGNWEYEQFVAFDHPDAGADGAETGEADRIELTFDVTFTDGDNDPVDASITIFVKDDGPVAEAEATIGVTVEEDGMSLSEGDLSEGNKDAGDTNDDDEADETSTGGANLNTLVSTGADEDLTFNLSTTTSGLSALLSKGVAVQYAVDTSGTTSDTLTAYAQIGSSTDGPGVGTEGVDYRVVFTLTVEEDGTWDFDLQDQLDHVAPPAGTAVENTELLLDGTTDTVSSIDFSGIVVATDADGDAVSPDSGSFTVTVEDDIPVAEAEATIGVTVEEDGMSLSEGDLSEGNKDAGDTNDDDEADETSTGGANLNTLVSTGADEDLTFNLSTTTSGLSALLSKGVAVQYAVDTSGTTSDTLTAYAQIGSSTDGPGVGTEGVDYRVVFTLTVEEDGTWDFDLQDQLDHVAPPAGTAVENTELLLDGTTDTVSSIDFSGIVVATDADGDAVSPDSGSFTVTVEDDIPVAEAEATIGVTVEEDGMSLSEGDLSEGNKDAGDTNDDDEADETSTGGANLNTLVSTGADEDLTFNLSTTTSGLSALLSKGVAVQYAVDTSGTTSDTLTAYAQIGSSTDGPGVGTEGVDYRVVFTLTVEEDGTWDFDLQDQLDHVAPPAGTAVENTELLLDGTTDTVSSIDFSGIVVATDADGDAVSPDSGSFTVTVEDDIPVAEAEATIGVTVEEDGMSLSEGDLSEGNKDAGDTNDDDEADETSTGGANLNTLVSTGADEDLTFNLSTTTSGLSALLSKGVAVQYAVDTSGTTSDTLTAYAQIGSSTDGPGVGTEGVDYRVVFTLTVEEDGTWDFDLQDQLDHVAPPAGTAVENTELLLDGTTDTVSSIDFSGIVVATDADGDAVSPDSGSFTVTVEDDIPISGTAETMILANFLDNTATADLDFSVGADEPGTYTLTGAMGADGEQTALIDDALVYGKVFNEDTQAFDVVQLTSGNVGLVWNEVSDTVWEAVNDVGGVVFTVTVNADGTYTVALDNPLGLDGGVGGFDIAFGTGVTGGNADFVALFDVPAGGTDVEAPFNVPDDAGIMLFMTAKSDPESDGYLSAPVNSSTQGVGVSDQDISSNSDAAGGPKADAPPEVLTLYFAEPNVDPTTVTDPLAQLTLTTLGFISFTLDSLNAGELAHFQAFTAASAAVLIYSDPTEIGNAAFLVDTLEGHGSGASADDFLILTTDLTFTSTDANTTVYYLAAEVSYLEFSAVDQAGSGDASDYRIAAIGGPGGATRRPPRESPGPGRLPFPVRGFAC